MKNVYFFLFVIVGILTHAQGPLRINELGFGCQTTKEDCSSKKRAWIELYNNSYRIIEGEVFLTNDTNDLTKWPVTKQHIHALKIKHDKYIIIGLKGTIGRFNYESEAQFRLGESVYLVLKDKEGLRVIDSQIWTPKARPRSTGVSSINDTIWSKNLYPTPKYNNFEFGTSRPRQRLVVSVAPFGLTGVSIEKSDGQKISPLLSYRFALHHHVVIKKEVDLQYGVFMSRVGYNSTYTPSTERSPFAERERTSTGKIRGKRFGLELRVGLELVPRLYGYVGIEGASQEVTTKISSELKITNFSTGETKSIQDETSSTSLQTNYFLGTSYELEYVIKERLSANIVYNSALDLGDDTSGKVKQWILAIGVKASVLTGKKHVKKSPVITF